MCVTREVAEILRRMQRAERHERLMRAKLNKVLAELRGGRPTASQQLLHAPSAQEGKVAASLNEGLDSQKGKRAPLSSLFMHATFLLYLRPYMFGQRVYGCC